MNKRDWIILAILGSYGYDSHRSLVQRTGYSLGLINSSLKKLTQEEYINSDYLLTNKAKNYMRAAKPKRAIILAAGMGLRMTPINQIPKGLLQINGEPLIEHIIRQLHEVEIHEIYIVVGFKMESFEYLTDKYGVELVSNNDFTTKNSLHSLHLVEDKLSNCYIVPCNVWFSRNPFSINEFFSWYAVSEFIEDDSYVRLNRKMELVSTGDEGGGNSMLGLCYLLEDEAEAVRANLHKFASQRKHSKDSWELALFDGDKMLAYARIMLGQSAYAIKTYEELRELDSESQNLQSRRINYISHMFNIAEDEITDISGLFKGMTNRHMRFSVGGKPYLLRIPGEGSNEIINREQEAMIYGVLDGKGISDVVTFISPEEGYKITEYWENSRNCDATNWDDVTACVKQLRRLHDMRLEVSHSFDIWEKTQWFERLRNSPPSFADYDETRSKMASLFELLEKLPKDRCLCHNDVADVNFMFVDDKAYLIDWEYGGMCDPHFDLAIFCIFADYDKEQIDRASNIYFDGCTDEISRLKVYTYCAVGGFLWSVWSEYKGSMGVDFGDYTMKQYRYAKRFYIHAMELATKLSLA